MNRNLFIYAAIVMGALAIALDFASVDLALPALERQFALDLVSVQWVINGYVLAFAVMMVAGGKIADAYGRKTIFLIGMGIFALASLLGGMAWSGGSVIGFRVLQGVGAALLRPAMIGMACAAVGDAKRGFALGLIFGTCSLGNAAGPVVGGALTEWFSWRWVLWVNVPMALLAMVITIWSVPKDAEIRGPRPRNDYAGMVALTGGLVALMIVVYQVQPWGWSNPKILGLSMLAIVLLGAFPFIEKRAAEPLVPLDLMRNREFQTLCVCVMVICQLFFIVLLYFTQFAMKFLGDDPIAAGLRVVVFMLSYGVVSYFGGPLTKRFGTRSLLLVGLVSAGLASLVLGWVGPGASWLPFNALLVLLGIGVGAVIPTVSARAIETAGTEKASLVSGITFMCQLAGSALMLAVNTAIFTTASTHHLNQLFAKEGVTLTSAEEAAVGNVMAGARNIHQLHLKNHTIAEVGDLAQIVTQAYLHGLQVIMGLSAVLVLVSFLMVLCFVPGRKPVT
ncbi:MAG: MFS transporter [Terrimicrobiaceae bacterium]